MTISTVLSDGSATLAQAVTVAIWDYQRLFGRGPRLIQIPYFRMGEMDAEMTLACHMKEPKFKGVPFHFSIVHDHIELQ